MLLQHRQGLLRKGFQPRVLKRALLLLEELNVLLMVFHHLLHESTIEGVPVELFQLGTLLARLLARAARRLHSFDQEPPDCSAEGNRRLRRMFRSGAAVEPCQAPARRVIPSRHLLAGLYRREPTGAAVAQW